MEYEEIFGQSPEEIAREITEFSQRVRDFNDCLPIYLGLYPNEWVAYFGGEIVCHSSDIEDFFVNIDGKAKELGIEDLRKKAFVQFLNPNPPTLIL